MRSWYKPRMRRWRCRGAALTTLILILGSSLVCAVQDAWSEPAAEFVRRILSRASRPATIALRFHAQPAATGPEAGEIRAAIETELERNGVALVESERAVAAVTVTFSENAQGHVWVAEIGAGGSQDVVMLGFPRSARRSAERAMFSIRHQLVLESVEPMLDVAVLQPPVGERMLLALHPGKLTLYRESDTGWEQEATALLPSRHFPRDQRGRLAIASDLTFDAYLPGMRCRGTVLGRFGAHCENSSEAWPLAASGRVKGRLDAERNYFTAVAISAAEPNETTSPFFNAARARIQETEAFVLAGVNGQSLLYEQGQEQPLTSWASWGSEIAGVESACGSGWQVLATAARDRSRPDTVQAFELAGREPVAVSLPLDLPGPVTALWPGPDPRSAIAIIRNLETGNDEALTLSLACQ